ncbi:MerR family transcriptional regulator [Streptomyces milbemycinicus]|uniref:MerR family transcriptional regulator n=1 Tax=Streptomyces milbemycinicus TaxID=476552 RepID=A0ABW8LQY5_9ACTN
MRIGDAAAAAGLTPRALRYYEERGLLTAHRTSSGHRDYTAEDVRHLRAVRELLTAGLTIEDVRALVSAIEALPANRRDRPALSEPRTDGPRADGEPGLCTVPNMIVRRRLAYLDERIERLTELRDGLAQRVGGPLRDLGRDLDPARTPAAG